jgi:sarcosine oxidase subunit alpha
VTTTTGGAAVVLDRFEEWLQTEWPDMQVFCTSVTEQWSVVAINGPRSRELVAAVGTDVDLSREAFPFMTFRDGRVAGVPGRLARVSFSGELAYELHVAGRHGAHVWDAVMDAGEPFGLEPYGTEAMHVLRAEKGYVIVGQDTDGSVTPADLGMEWIVNPSKGDFIGRRSLRRADLVRPERKQLVGLFPEDPSLVLPEGSQLVLDEDARIPVSLAGHVTSSYRSAALERSFALAMLNGGHDKHGRTVYAPLRDRTVACTVTSPVPYDPEGLRRDG